jgi:hypothetical protein
MLVSLVVVTHGNDDHNDHHWMMRLRILLTDTTKMWSMKNKNNGTLEEPSLSSDTWEEDEV